MSLHILIRNNLISSIPRRSLHTLKFPVPGPSCISSIPSSSIIKNENKQLLENTDCVHNRIGQTRGLRKINEPEYLDVVGYQIPTYELINIHLKGYDFSVLEKFQSFIYRTIERVGLEVEDSWGTPAQKLKISKLKPESAVVDAEYQLNLYERTIQISDLPTTMLPIVINIVEAALPAGVSMNVKQHTKEDTEIRFIPDLELKELKEELVMDPIALLKKKKAKIVNVYKKKPK